MATEALGINESTSQPKSYKNQNLEDKHNKVNDKKLNSENKEGNFPNLQSPKKSKNGSEISFDNFKEKPIMDFSYLKRIKPENNALDEKNDPSIVQGNYSEKVTKKIMNNGHHDKFFMSGAKKNYSRVEREQIYLREMRELKNLKCKTEGKKKMFCLGIDKTPHFKIEKNINNAWSLRPKRKKLSNEKNDDNIDEKDNYSWEKFNRALKSPSSSKNIKNSKIVNECDEHENQIPKEIDRGNQSESRSSSTGRINDFNKDSITKDSRRSISESPKIIHLPNPLETYVICDCKRHSHEFRCSKKRRSSQLKFIEEKEEEKESSKKKFRESRLSSEIEPFQEESTSELIKYYYGSIKMDQKSKIPKI